MNSTFISLTNDINFIFFVLANLRLLSKEISKFLHSVRFYSKEGHCFQQETLPLGENFKWRYSNCHIKHIQLKLLAIFCMIGILSFCEINML